MYKGGGLPYIIKQMKEVLFPVFCIFCKKEGTLLCSQCAEQIPIQGVFLCPVCAQSTGGGEACGMCKPESVLGYIHAMFSYRNRIVASLIEQLKYAYQEETIPIFVAWIRKYYHLYPPQMPVDMIVPVPLHARRYAERGFNQAMLLAKIVANILDVPCNSILIRTRNTKQQAKLDRAGRIENVANAFAIKKSCSVPQHILLVDDVYTTGSTIRACAEVLRRSGAEEVSAWVVARGEVLSH